MANNITSILKRRFPESQYALMEEVSDAAGFSRSNSADYIAVGLWPSRGLPVIGIELKSSRSDWLRELKNHAKAENIFQYCDHFWLLTTDDTMAKIEEIPISWGWMCIKGERIFVKKEAPSLTPKPISKHFLCAMLKRAQDKSGFVSRDSIQDEINAAKEAGKNAGSYAVTQLEKELKSIQQSVTDFEQISGIRLAEYSYYFSDNTKKVAEAVKFLKNGGIESIKKQLLGLKPIAQSALDKINDQLKEIQL